MKQSAKIAMGGVFSALSLVLMLCTLFPYATYALAALAGMALLPVALECGKPWALGAYVVVAVLSFLLAPDMEAKLLFVTFFGYYPILKLWLDRLSKPVGWLLKLVAFNTAMVGGYALLLTVFHLDPQTFELFGLYLPLVFLLVGDVVFVVYDRVLAEFVMLYYTKWRDRMARLFH